MSRRRVVGASADAFPYLLAVDQRRGVTEEIAWARRGSLDETGHEWVSPHMKDGVRSGYAP